MSLLLQILLLTLLGSVLSLAGGVILALRKRRFTHRENLLIISFTAGVLLATAFFDLLPEAEEGGAQVLLPMLAGIVFLFMLEKSLIWYHHHGHLGKNVGSRTPLMITLGDVFHNAMDGVVIASAAIASPATGLVTALAVGAHEIPQEIGDFGILLAKGWSKAKTIRVNILASLSAVLAAVLTYFFRARLEAFVPHILAFAGGMFTYLACSDLIPELHHGCDESCDSSSNLVQAAVFLGGIGLVYFLVEALHGLA